MSRSGGGGAASWAKAVARERSKSDKLRITFIGYLKKAYSKPGKPGTVHSIPIPRARKRDDLHLKGPRDKEPWRRRRVLGEAWQSNLETLLNEEGVIDFVFFTGDAAQSGQPDEFAEATAFLTALCTELSLDPSRLFIIPGNHDIDRHIERAACEKLRMSLAASSDLLSVSRWLNGLDRRPPVGFDDAWKTAVLARQRPYRDWLKNELSRPELAPDGLGYRASFTLPGWSQPLHIVGLDTAWLCGDDADKAASCLPKIRSPTTSPRQRAILSPACASSSCTIPSLNSPMRPPPNGCLPLMPILSCAATCMRLK